MTSDEIQKMPDEDLDAVIWATLAPWPSGFLKGDLMFCDSLDHCHAAEERLAEMGLVDECLRAVEEVTSRAQDADLARYPWRWYIAHATARQRAEAILMAVQGVIS